MAAVGNAPPGQRLWSQFRPVIHPSPRLAAQPLDYFGNLEHGIHFRVHPL